MYFVDSSSILYISIKEIDSFWQLLTTTIFLRVWKLYKKKQSFSAETTKVKKSCLRINKDRFFIMVLQNSFTFISWIQLLSDTKCNICSLFELNYFLWEDDIFRKQKMFCFLKNTRRCSASLRISSSNKRK